MISNLHLKSPVRSEYHNKLGEHLHHVSRGRLPILVVFSLQLSCDYADKRLWLQAQFHLLRQ